MSVEVKTTIIRKRRDSNMELLRIFAMLIIMIVHADFRALNVPSSSDALFEPFPTLGKLLVESFSIVGVNVFVLLSGWYGIKVRKERFLEFLFQIFFFICLCYLFISIFLQHFISPSISYFLMLGEWNYWFIKCYLFLYLFSPVLNAFAEKATKNQFLFLLTSFFIFQTIYGWVGNVGWFHNGYSGISFLGLYLLSRYLRLYPCKWIQFDKKYDILIYVVLSLLITTIAFLSMRFHLIPYKITFFYQYTSPVVIISSVFFLLYFTKLKINYNPLINWIASSCFAIYLLHSNSYLACYYDDFIEFLYNKYDNPLFIFSVLSFIFIVFITCILIDKIRIAFWRKIQYISGM